MSGEKSTIEITQIEGKRYQATDGKRVVLFDIGDSYTVTIVNKEGGKKPLIFYGSKPVVLLAMGRILKHISGFVMGMKNKAKETE